jgi:isopenicillin N synthase-like dioxygenase
MEKSFPMIDMALLNGEEREIAMKILQDACENWGFFEVPQTRSLICTSIEYQNTIISTQF